MRGSAPAAVGQCRAAGTGRHRRRRPARRLVMRQRLALRSACWASRKCCCWTNPPPAWTRPRASCSTASSPSCARRRHHPAQHARPVRAGRTRRPRRGHEGRTQDRRRHPVRTAPAHRPAAAHPPDAGRAWVRVWVWVWLRRAAAPPWRALDSGRYERLCAEDEKVAAIRAIGAIGQDIRDLDIDVPGLDEIYAHLLEREDI